MADSPRRDAPATVIFAGGGTGGHLFPGLAVAEQILQRRPETVIVFVGAGRDIERQILDQYDYEYRVVDAEPSTSLWSNPLKFFKRGIQGHQQTRSLLKEFDPDVVVGLGGFASVPMVNGAQRSGVPTILLEQNTLPGRATRWLARRAKLVCLSLQETESHLARGVKTLVTGNPVRAAIADLAKSPRTANRQSQLLILGGSQGSTAVNAAVAPALRSLNHLLDGWNIIHQIGAREEGWLKTAYRALNAEVQTRAFIEDMPKVLGESDLVISRSGATTLAELACAGCASLLIPLPGSMNDHQHYNATSFEAAGAAVLLEESSQPAQTVRLLQESLEPLLSEPALRVKMGQAARSLARPEAARLVAREVWRHVMARRESQNPREPESADDPSADT